MFALSKYSISKFAIVLQSNLQYQTEFIELIIDSVCLLYPLRKQTKKIK